MKIEEILSLATEDEKIAMLQEKAVNVPTYKDLKDQYEPKGHKIFDTTLRPDKPVMNDAGEVARYEKVARIAIAFQRLIVKRANSFLFGNPVELKAEPADESETAVYNAVKRILSDNKETTLNRKIGRFLMSQCEVAEVWFPVPESHSDYGFQSKYKLRHTIFSPQNGDELYPLFDETGDLIAFSRAYTVKKKECFETYTKDLYLKWEKVENNWSPVVGPEGNIQNPIKKIPVVYSYQPEPEWEDVQHLIERFETLASNFADTNDYHGSPKIFINGTINGFSKKGETGAIIEGDENARAQYLTWESAPESIKLEIETLKWLIYTLTQTPDISFDSMKSIGTLSGVALKLLFLDAHMKVEDKKEIIDAHLKRRISIIKSFVTYMNPKLEKAGVINISPEITPYIISDTKTEVETLVTANGNKPIISQKTSVRLGGLTIDPDAEYEQIKKEDTEANTSDLFSPTNYQAMNKGDAAHFSRLENYASKIQSVYLKAVDELARLASGLKFNPDKPFSFDNLPGAKVQAEKIFTGLADNVTTIIDKGMKDEIESTFASNEQIVKRLTKRTSAPAEVVKKFKLSTAGAAEAFQARKTNGMNLSERVWKYRDQFKSQIEMGLDVSLGQGLSAQQTSRDLKQYLQYPDKLFRRVRDARGNLHLSRRAASFHPGRGVYRSSHKNAMRLARTEINRAYHESNHQRWQSMDFVVGYEVILSNNHPVDDICDSLKGKYPKTFKFSGWHPHCRCHAVPILCTPEEYDQYERELLAGNENAKINSVNEVNNVPGGFYKWIAENKTVINNATSIPFWITDNFRAGSVNAGLKNNIVNEATYKQIMNRAEALVSTKRAAMAAQLEAVQGDIQRTEAAVRVEQRRQAQRAARAVKTRQSARNAAEQVKKAASAGIKAEKWEMSASKIESMKSRGFSIEASDLKPLGMAPEKAYNEVMSGYNLFEFDDELTKSLVDSGLKIISRKITFDVNHIRLRYLYEDAFEYGELTRSFRLADGGKTRVCVHSHFDLPSKVKDAGLGKKVFKALYKQYQNAGIQKLEVLANIDVGGYVWGRYGFCIEGRYSAENYLGGLGFNRGEKLYDTALNVIKTYYKGRKNDDLFPMNLLADIPGMKAKMLGSDWYGDLYLTDPVQRQRFEDYLFGRIK